MVAGCDENEPISLQRGVSIALRGESLIVETQPVPTMVLLPEPTNKPTALSETEKSPQPVVTGVGAAEQSDVCAPQVDRQFESSVIAGLNQSRITLGLPPLAEQSQLNQIARSHSQQMACFGFFSHADTLYGLPAERARQAGYQFSAIGEVIASGYLDYDEVLAAWLESDAHREILLNGQFTQIGVGYAYLENSEHGQYWTVLLGNP